MKANQKVREQAQKKRVKHWQIAERLGISEPTIMRWLRVPLTEEREKAILAAINELGKEVE